MSITVLVKKTDDAAMLPQCAHSGDAAFDMFSHERVEIAPGTRVQISTGLCFEIPEGYGMFIWDRSSLSHKHGLKTLGGVIDATYRGEVRVGLVNLGNETYVVEKGDRIAQALIQKVHEVTFSQAEELSETSRGAGGFGSTGK